MNKETASKIIRETFNNSFDKERFVRFTKELFNYYEPDTFIYRGNFIPDAFDPQIRTLERVGKYTDPDGNKIDILIVQLKRASSLERARTMQRNFIAWYLNGSRGGKRKDAAIVAFIAPDNDDWRFSLVKMDYHLEEGKSGKVNPRKELTPARRWSFLVGKNENSHTAQKQLLEILQNDSDNKLLHYDTPSLSDFEQAFNIEKVTKEFFEKYRELFINVKEALEAIVKTNLTVKREFEAKSVDTVDFSKKLLGQIVFLYFLQKKGWFGVPRGKNWGEGDKHFLRHLQEKAEQNNKNFFNDYLEPLFYQALRYDRSADDDYFSQFDCKIPFLNGGLFDPMNDYDWINTDIVLPNDLFANKHKTKEGDVGTGILDVFDRYNFTVKEDEPLEKDVAVDPEMLGRAYEKFNAIRADNYHEYLKALKSGKKGEESKFNKQYGVYYTPREIVHYMCQESLANYLATEVSSVIPSEARNLKEDIETLIKFGETAVEHDSRVTAEGRETKDYSFKLSESIRKNAELIDEKLATIRVCDPAVGSGAFPVGMMSEIIRTRNALTPYIEKNSKRTPYNFKRHAVQSSLYGVDIDPGAIEIAKLRLWLSLIVDEEDIKQIKPLPNLDYKIMQGNSLLSIQKTDTSGTPDMFYEEKMRMLHEKKQLYFNETSASKKKEHKEQIDELISQITNGHTEFDFEVYFSEVFHEKQGFDVVIANPPYIDSERMVKEGHLELRKTIAKTYKLTKGNWDIYIAFFEKGFGILNSNGTLTFITPDKWISKPFGDALRINKLQNLFAVLKAGREVFEDVKVDAIVSIFTNKVQDCIYAYLSKPTIFLKHIIKKNILKFPYALDVLFSTSLDLIQKIGNFDTKLSDAFICESACATSDAYKLKPLIHDIQKATLITANHLKMVNTGTIGKYVSRWGVQPMVYLGDKYLFPVVEKQEFQMNFKNTYSKKAIKPKIILKGLNLLDAFLDEEGIVIPGKTTLIIYSKTDDKDELRLILGLINSSLIFYYIKEKYSASSYNQGITFTKDMINNFPIPTISKIDKRSFGELVNEVLDITKDDDYLQNPAKQAKVRAYEKQIDQMGYKLYDLTPEEIAIVEGHYE